jgi:hypothetical protein
MWFHSRRNPVVGVQVSVYLPMWGGALLNACFENELFAELIILIVSQRFILKSCFKYFLESIFGKRGLIFY